LLLGEPQREGEQRGEGAGGGLSLDPGPPQRIQHDLGAPVRGLSGHVLLRCGLHEVRVRQQQVVHRPEHRGDLLLPGERARPWQFQLRQYPVGQRAQEVLLGAHVAVEGHGRDAAARGQRAHVQAVVPVLGDQLGGGVDDVPAG